MYSIDFPGFNLFCAVFLMVSTFEGLRQTINGWDIGACEQAVKVELGARFSGVAPSQVRTLCECMSSRWEDVLDVNSFADGVIGVADACVSDWRDGVVLSWKNSGKGMTLPLEQILDQQAWLDQLWLLGESVWLVTVTIESEARARPGEDGDVVEFLKVGDRAVAYLDEQVGEYSAVTTLNSGKTSWVRQERLLQLQQLEMIVDLGFVEIGATGTDMCEIAVRDSSSYDMMMNMRKGGLYQSFEMKAHGPASRLELPPGNYQYLAWIPSEQAILPSFGVSKFEPGVAYQWVFFVSTR